MFTFGYKTKHSSIVRAVGALGVGIVMLGGSDAPTTVVRIIACFLLAAGLVSFGFGMLKHRNDNSFHLLALNAAVDVVLALVLFFNPELISKFMVFGIGIVLIVLGALQLIVLIGACSLVGAGSPMMVLSFLALVGGAFLLFSPFGVRVMESIAGCLLIVYGVSELLSIRKVSKARTASEIKTAAAKPSSVRRDDEVDDSSISEAKEVDFHKVGD